MAQISRSTKVSGGTTLQSNTLARAVDIETDMLALFTAHNNHDTGTSKWTVVSAEGASSVPLSANNLTGTQNIFEAKDNGTAVLSVADGGASTVTATGAATVALTVNNGTSTGSPLIVQDNGSAILTVKDGGQITGSYISSWLSYRRPNLQFISITTVDVEVNTTTANTTTIVFPDGEVRTVTEDTSSTNKYRRFDITATANFTSGTEDSGVRSGIAEATNTWYAIYAVKSVIDATKFVLAGDTTLPLVANASTLNSRYGTNSWTYLGMIRNGDNAGATGDILAFFHHGNMTLFKNVVTGNVINSSGLRLATSASATTLTYGTSDGTGTTDIPNHIRIVGLYGAAGTGSGSAEFGNGSVTQEWASGSGGARFATRILTHVADAKLTNGTASSMDILLFCWIDPLLGSGMNPLL
jgi:hypothetical protein